MLRPSGTSPRRLSAILPVLALALIPAASARADLMPGYALVADNTFPTNDVAMAPGITASGWNIHEMIFSYNKTTDTLDVDVKMLGNVVAGDADASYNQGQYDPKLTPAGGVNPIELQGRKSIDVAFNAVATNSSVGAPLAIAGVPEYKSPALSTNSTTAVQAFQLAKFVPGAYGLENSYGSQITAATGTLLYSPSATHPDFEFTIANFSKIPGVTLSSGLYFSAFAGSPDDIVVGEKSIGYTYIPGFNPQPQGTTNLPNGSTPGGPVPTPFPSAVPEPASLALVGLGGLGLIFGRKRRVR